MNLTKTLIICFILLFSTASLSADIKALLEEETNHYIKILSEAKGESLIDVASQITMSGLNEQRLFDKVKDILNEKHKYNISIDDKDLLVIHQIINLLRTLASSGVIEYAYTIRRVLEQSENRAIRNRAKHLLSKFDFYNKKNRIMNHFDNHQEGQSLHSTRLLNLLNYDDLIMNRFAAEEIVRKGTSETVVQELIAERLKQQVRNEGSGLQIDTLAWYCKVLGTVNKDKYRDFLNSIAKDKAIDYKIRRHTKKILE